MNCKVKTKDDWDGQSSHVAVSSRRFQSCVYTVNKGEGLHTGPTTVECPQAI
jgi:hypothetical protein